MIYMYIYKYTNKCQERMSTQTVVLHTPTFLIEKYIDRGCVCVCVCACRLCTHETLSNMN